ncbi:MAG: ABC transporter permease, partial [Acidobacteriota bacterium]
LAGCLVAVALRALLLPALPRVTTTWTSYGLLSGAAPFDTRVFLFALLLGLLAAVVFALAPVLGTLRTSPRSVLQGAASAPQRGLAPGSLRAALPAVQVALAVLLLGGAMLMVRSLLAARSADPGFDADGVVVARVELAADRYPGGTRDFYLSLLERVRAMPAVESASLATSLAYRTIGYGTNLAIEGVDSSFEDFEARRRVRLHFVEREFFATLRLRLWAGRTFDARDISGAPDVAVVNRTLAEQMFPGVDPVGHRVAFGLGRGGREWFEIVGVVEDAYYRGIHEVIEPEAYVAYRQSTPASAYVYVRASGEAAGVVPVLRDVVDQLDPTAAIYDVQTLDEAGASSRADTRSLAALLSGFAALALLLAAGGLYGTMAFAVAARARELGIRKSLGATRRVLVAQILTRGMRLTLIGIAIGYLVGMWLVGLLQARLWGVAPYDPVTGVAAAITLLATGIAASLIPALRAARADAVTVLRGD